MHAYWVERTSHEYSLAPDRCFYPHSNIYILLPNLVLVEEGGVQRQRAMRLKSPNPRQALTINPALLSSERPKKRRRSSSPEPAKESGVPQQKGDVVVIVKEEVSPLLDLLPNVMPDADLGQSTGPSTLSESGVSGPPTPCFDYVLDTPSEDGLSDCIRLPSDSEDVTSD
ncbi:hypothetical protein BC835DRAFT_738851 [Cytidiella melzeri]|nr:hypothetical protein BC835DRAFT_738851 [Cytidiella melzeri]